MDRLKPFFKTRYRFCQQEGAAFRLVQLIFLLLKYCARFLCTSKLLSDGCGSETGEWTVFFPLLFKLIFDDHEEIHEKNKKLWTIW
jgi:hypothetical protein